MGRFKWCVWVFFRLLPFLSKWGTMRKSNVGTKSVYVSVLVTSPHKQWLISQVNSNASICFSFLVSGPSFPHLAYHPHQNRSSGKIKKSLWIQLATFAEQSTWMDPMKTFKTCNQIRSRQSSWDEVLKRRGFQGKKKKRRLICTEAADRERNISLCYHTRHAYKPHCINTQAALITRVKALNSTKEHRVSLCDNPMNGNRMH